MVNGGLTKETPKNGLRYQVWRFVQWFQCSNSVAPLLVYPCWLLIQVWSTNIWMILFHNLILYTVKHPPNRPMLLSNMWFHLSLHHGFLMFRILSHGIAMWAPRSLSWGNSNNSGLWDPHVLQWGWNTYQDLPWTSPKCRYPLVICHIAMANSHW